mgnify:CR=1 FL=1
MTFQHITLSRLINMKHLLMAATIAALLTGLVFYTLLQATKQYDAVYQSNSSMIMLHKLEYSNAVDEEY